MQGDIFHLSEVQQQQNLSPKRTIKTKTATTITKDNVQVSSAFVSIWNDDDLSEYLYLPSQPAEDLTAHHHPTPTAAQIHAHYLEKIAAAFDDYCTDDNAGHDSSDECAVFSDIEDDFDEEHHQAAPKTSTETHPRRPRSWHENSGVRPVFTAGPPAEVHPTQHADCISGPLMSWWPLPMSMQEHQWSQQNRSEAGKVAVPDADANIMNWWPMSTPSNCDWNERFFE